MHQIQCPHCGQPYTITPQQAPQYAGRAISCTKCHQAFTVPQLPAFAPAMMPAADPGQPGQLSYATPAAPQQTNGLAIASLITGILGFCVPLLGIVGLVLGIMGLRRARQPGVSGQGMAMAGIITGTLGIVISGCSLSIMLPSLARARETANRVKCASNMRQIGLAIMMYANDNGGEFPDQINPLMAKYGLNKAALDCPTSEMPANFNAGEYIYVGAGLNTNSADSDKPVLYEPMHDHDDEGANVLYADGHVEWLTWSQASTLIDQIENPQDYEADGTPKQFVEEE